MNNYSIRAKLYCLAGLVAAFLVILTFIAINAINQISLLNQTKQLVQESEVLMLTLRRNEKDFLARLDTKYLDKFIVNSQTLQQTISRLNTAIAESSLVREDPLVPLTALLDDYFASFKTIVQINQQIGLSPKQGLRGDLRNAVHDAESLLHEHNLIELTASMLLLRRNEKDFIMRKQPKYMVKFIDNFERFSRQLSLSSLSNERQQPLQLKMSSYKDGFLTLHENYLQLGLTHDQGLQGEMRNAVHKTEQIFSQLNQKITEQVASEISFIKTKLLYTSAGFILLTILMVLFTALSILKRLNFLKDHLGEVALSSGDLSAQLDIGGSDELTEISLLFNQFVSNLKHSFSAIPAYSASLQQASITNTKVSQQTYQLAMHQQSESDLLEEAANSMLIASNEINESTQRAANNAREASEFVSLGMTSINQVGSSINSLTDKLQSSAQVISELENNSRDIGSVLDVISTIAEQTNLLALNAAIEAARAGENGRGFAVVADEVRNLAKQTKESTVEIKTLIDKFQENVENTIKVMGEGSEGALSVSETAGDAIKNLEKISQSVAQIFDINQHIATASEQQQKLSSEINKSITNINSAAKDSASQSKENSQSSEYISSVAAQLQESVAFYKF